MRKVNEAKPSSLNNDWPLLGDTESIARAGGHSIMTDLKLPTSLGDAGTSSPPSEPWVVRAVREMNLAAITAPIISPQAIAAHEAASQRRDTELINRYVAGEVARRRAAGG